MLATGPLNATAADDPLRGSKQHHLEQHRRRIGRGAGLVIAKARVETGQIDLVIEQVVQRVLESTRQQLPRQINREQPRAGIDVLVAGHPDSPNSLRSSFELAAHFRSV